jgi:hypothetical protein
MFAVTRRIAIAGLAVSALATSVVAGPAPTTSAASPSTIPVVALSGYSVSVWAKGTAAYSNPDSIVSDRTHVFVGYQDVTAKDGTDGKYSTVVEYTIGGKKLRTFKALGHCDGLRIDPSTHLLWALADEDGDPHLTTIDPVTGASVLYKFPTTPHGGGYDDMAFVNGMALIDASNPTLDKNGINVYPALDKITITNGNAKLTPVLMGNASSLDITAKANKMVKLNLIDPDSLTFDPRGDLVLDNQAGAQLVFVHGAGTSHQRISSLTIGTQVDDTQWATSAHGKLLVSDTGANTIYAVDGGFTPGTAYATTPNDSGVAGFVGAIDQTSGIVTPVVIGLSSPHGMIFAPSAL